MPAHPNTSDKIVLSFAISLSVLAISATIIKAANAWSFVWQEGPHMRIAMKWNAPERRDGPYASPEPWPQTRLAADRAYDLAARHVLSQEWNLNQVIENTTGWNGFVYISEAETNYPDGHADYPPHVHFIYVWPSWSGHVNTHFYTTDDGTVNRALVLWDVNDPNTGAAYCPVGDKTPDPGAWFPEYAEDCRVVWEQRFTSEGTIQMRRNADSPVYTLSLERINGDLATINVLQNNDLAATIDITEYDGLNPKMVAKTANFKAQTLTTEVWTGDSASGGLKSHTTDTAPLNSTSPTPTPTPSATPAPTTSPTPEPTPTPITTKALYVSPTGNDSNNGTQESPFRTLAKAASAVTPGTTVYLRKGVYNERLTPRVSGTADAPIIFTAYPGEEHQAVIDLQDPGYDSSMRGYGAVHIDSKSYVTVSNLRIINSGYHGVFMRLSDHINIVNNQFDWIYASAIIVINNNRYINIDGNDIQRATHKQGGTDQLNEIISVMIGTENFEVKNNRLHNMYQDPVTGNYISKEGIDIKDGARNGKVYNNYVNLGHGHAIYLDAFDDYVENVEVFNNESTGNRRGIIIAAEKQIGVVRGVKVYNNIVHHNQVGLTLPDGWVEGGYVHDVEVINNTAYANEIGIHVVNRESSGLVVKNNLSIGNTRNYDLSAPNIAQSNNISGTDATIFVDAGKNDFRLRSSASEAIDKGTYLPAPFDKAKDGTPRPQGSAFDAGAYEYKDTVSATPVPCSLVDAGDTNCDNTVDLTDYSTVISSYGTNDKASDFDKNGIVDIFDINRVVTSIIK